MGLGLCPKYNDLGFGQECGMVCLSLRTICKAKMKYIQYVVPVSCQNNLGLVGREIILFC